MTQTTWILELVEDPETGDLVLEFPDELIKSQGWQFGDTLSWEIDPDSQNLTLRKINPEDVST